MKKYASLIIDIKKSRDYEAKDRNQLQNFLVEAIDQLNIIFKETIVFPVTFSAGDEMQGLFKFPVQAFQYLRMLNLMVFPVQLRAGIGIGNWDIRIEGGESTQQDGPAYHRAREAIIDVYKMQTQHFRICSGTKADIMANYLINLSMHLLADQNGIQNRVQWICEMLYPFCMENDRVLENYIDELSKLKYQYGIQGKSTDKKSDVYQRLILIEPIKITRQIEEPERVVYQKRTSRNIAQITGTTRQNIDMVMKRGSVMEIRTMDYMALQYLYKVYGP